MNKAEFEDLRSQFENDEITEDELDEDAEEADAMLSFGDYDEYEEAVREEE